MLVYINSLLRSSYINNLEDVTKNNRKIRNSWLFSTNLFEKKVFLQPWQKRYIPLLHKPYWNRAALSQDYVNTLKFTQKPWSRSFKWGTKHWFWSKGCKDIRGRKKYLPTLPALGASVPSGLSWQIFFLTSIFDLWYAAPLPKSMFST